MSRAPWLTRSQVDRIARLLADGATSREIVRLMGVSAGTVHNVRMGKVAGKRPSQLRRDLSLQRRQFGGVPLAGADDGGNS